MKFFSRFKKQKNIPDGTVIYIVEGMDCSHCKASVEQAVGSLDGVTSVEANPRTKTLAVAGTASVEEIRKAVESAGFVSKGELR